MRIHVWTSLAFLAFFQGCAKGQISDKGRKLFNDLRTTTEDSFFAFNSGGGPADFGGGSSLELEQGSDSTVDLFDDDAWDFGDEDFGFGTDFLRPCTELSENELELGVSCDNSTLAEPEIRHRDPLFERLLSQVWSDYQYKLNEEASLYGLKIDPLDVDPLLKDPAGISLKQTGTGYSADVTMDHIKVYGLSGINMSENVVTRSENLTDIDFKITFAFDQLIINGSYSLKGYVGFWSVDSQGIQNFSIIMKKATLTYGTKMDLVDSDSDWTRRRCNEHQFMSDQSDVLITEISLPLNYQDVDFKFNNLGAFANNLVNGVGMYFLQTQEDVLVGKIKKAIKLHVNSLIC